MITGQSGDVLHHLRRAALLQDGGGMTDGRLLECFLTQRDEAAFEALMRRHGPMVWAVCRRLLRDPHDAEDAFQATFLVLVRKAASITRRESVGSWLYGVAYRAALEARAVRRRSREKQVSAMPEPEAVVEADAWRDVRPLLDQELSRLPAKYREAVVLCHLEGKTRKEAARQVGVSEGTLSGRLTTARRLLARRLARHGLAPSGGALVTALSQSAATADLPAPLVVSTIKAAAWGAAGPAACGPASARVAALTEGVLRKMFLTRLKVTAILLAAVLTGTGAGHLLHAALANGASEPAILKSDSPKPEPKPAGPAKTDKEKLQGTWIVESATIDGKEDEKARGSTVTFDGNRALFKGNEENTRGESYLFKLDPGQDPKTIELVKETSQTGKKRYGTYLLEDHRLTLALADKATQRPKDFTTGPALVLKRKQDKQEQPKQDKEKAPALSQEAVDALEFELAELRGKVKKLETVNGHLRQLLEADGLSGVLKKVDAKKNTVSVTLRGTTLDLENLPIAADAKIFLDEKECKIDALTEGQRAYLELKVDGDKTLITAIHAKS